MDKYVFRVTPEPAIFEFAQTVGIQKPFLGQAHVFNHVYGPGVFQYPAPYDKDPDAFWYHINTEPTDPLPKTGIVAYGRRSGMTTAATLILAFDAIHFLNNWPITQINMPYFVLAVPTKDQVAYVVPVIKQWIDRYVLHSNGVRNINTDVRCITDRSLEYDFTRDTITVWNVNSPDRKVRILVKPATVNVFRGCAAQTVILDSLAHFNDAKDFYHAILPTKRLLVFSTPVEDPKNFFNWLYHHHKEAKYPNVWQDRLPTWIANPDVEQCQGSETQMREAMSKWYVPSPDYFDREFGAKVPKAFLDYDALENNAPPIT